MPPSLRSSVRERVISGAVRKLWPRLAPALTGVLGCTVVLLVALQLVAGFTPAYHGAVTRAEVKQATGLEPAELQAILRRVLDYSLGRHPDLQLVMPDGSLRQGESAFSQRELDHMVDVRQLFATSRVVVGISFCLGLVLALWPIALRRPCAPCACDRGFWSATLQWSGLWGLAAMGGLSLAAVTDFGRAFDAFHLALFRNDLWQLPAESLLILMLLDWQFARLAGLTGALAALAFVSLILLGRGLATPYRSGSCTVSHLR